MEKKSICKSVWNFEKKIYTIIALVAICVSFTVVMYSYLIAMMMQKSRSADEIWKGRKAC